MCRRAANQRLRPAGYRTRDAPAKCVAAADSESGLCARCKCEWAGCTRQRRHTAPYRWCHIHQLQWENHAGRKGYVTAAGPQMFPGNADIHKMASMRIGWVWERMLPWDLTELLRGMREVCPARPGATITPLAFARSFLAHAIKWPPLLRWWVRETAASTTAAGLVAAYVKMIRYADGQPWTEMHARMSGGKMHIFTGLVAHAHGLRLIRDGPPGRDEESVNLGVR